MGAQTATWGLVCVGMVLGASPAKALNMLTLEASMATPRVGASVSFRLAMSFDDVTVGGGVRLSFDEAFLRLDSVSFASGLADDPDFRCPTDPAASSPVSCPMDPNFLSFGGFAGLSGDRTVATIVFDALAPSGGPTRIDLLAERPFSSEVGTALDVSFAGTSVSVVPEPGVALLLAMAAAGATALRRQHGGASSEAGRA